jgi:hypothetical protein
MGSSSFLDFLRRLLGISQPGTSGTGGGTVHPVVPPDTTTEPARIITSHVLLVVYEPFMDPAGTRMSDKMKYNRPDSLVNDYLQDILEVSGGLGRYEVVQRVELNEFPALSDGFRYTSQSILPVLNRTQSHHEPKYIDYQAILTGLNVLPRINTREIDEVWLMGFPWAGFYESTMGGAGAFPCNSNPQTWSAGTKRRFIVMGFNYERGVGEMLHSFGHRCEAILSKTFEKIEGEANLYKKYITYDLVSPGESGLGTIHNLPNSDKEYDYTNQRMVMSNCYDWYNFPHFLNDSRLINAKEWGGGLDTRLVYKWWLNHLPKVSGRINGIANNWWQYVMDPNLVIT